MSHFYLSGTESLDERVHIGTISDIAELLHTDVNDAWHRYVPLILKRRLSILIDTDAAFACRSRNICIIVPKEHKEEVDRLMTMYCYKLVAEKDAESGVVLHYCSYIID